MRVIGPDDVPEPGASARVHPRARAERLTYVAGGRPRFPSDGGRDDVMSAAAVRVRGAAKAPAATGADRLRVLVSFSPDGFEQRFTSWEWALGDQPATRPQALLDLTGLPWPQRHRTVIAALEALDPGVPLVVVNDHEPSGLQRQLERRYEDRLRWEVRARAGDRVAVAIWLGGPGSGTGGPLTGPALELSPSAA